MSDTTKAAEGPMKLSQSLKWAQAVLGPFDIIGSTASGSYNVHRVLRTKDAQVIVLRIRLATARELDARPLPEFDVLESVGLDPILGDHVPGAIAEDPDLGCALYWFVGERVLDEVAPKKHPLPRTALSGLPCAMGSLSRVTPASAWHEAQARFGASFALTDSHTTYDLAVAGLTATYRRLHQSNSAVLAFLGMPTESMLAEVLTRSVSRRRPVMLHGDIHRKNLRLSRDHESWFLLDWEMAQIGDAVYDLAVALWKLKLPHDDRRDFVTRWERVMPSDTTQGWLSDLTTYLSLERLKTVINHIYRSADALRTIPIEDLPAREAVAERWIADRWAVQDQLGPANLNVGEVARALTSIR